MVNVDNRTLNHMQQGQLVPIRSYATNESRVVCFMLEAAFVKTPFAHIFRAVWCALLKPCSTKYYSILVWSIWPPCELLVLLHHHHQSHCLHVCCHLILLSATIFSERDKSVHFNIIALNNVYVYYTMHVGELNGGYMYNEIINQDNSDNQDSWLMRTKHTRLLCPH